MNHVAIVSACRTPIGTIGGQFKTLTALDLSIPVMQALIQRSGVDPALIDDVIWGCNYQRTYLENNLARVAAIKAGLPDTVPGITVHRNCTSSMSSIQLGFYQIMAGEAKCIMAGGADCMSAAPFMVFDARYGKKYGHMELRDSMWDSLTNLGVGPSMGITAENVAEQYGVTRRMQDEFSMESHRRANAARTEGKFAQEIIPVEAVTTYVDETGHTRMGLRTVAEDEGIRPQTTMESLGKLHTVFKLGGTVTPGNSSQTSDGAAFVILMSGEKAAELGVRPIAKFISFAVAGVPSELMGIGPIAAIPKALKIAGLRQEDMDIIELNEAFAAQSLACINTLGLDQKKVNVNGGAIAMGHPLGCTGSLLTVKVIRELQRRDGRYGMVSMCIGGGMGAAGVFERLS